MVENVSSAEAWRALEGSTDAQLVDVRTTAEWSYFGIPDLEPLGKRATLIPWQEFPSGEINPDFRAELSRAKLDRAQPLYFICRSGARSLAAPPPRPAPGWDHRVHQGARSLAAAREAAAAGWTHVFNVADGFEGPPDRQGHRGLVAGWKAAGLPWRQS